MKVGLLALSVAIVPLAATDARAASCSSVIAGAETGPAPTFTSWPYGDACYITWPGGYIDGMNARTHYEKVCDGIPGRLFFSGDYGSNVNTCVFSAPAGGERRDAASEPKDSEPKGSEHDEPEVRGRMAYDKGQYQDALRAFEDGTARHSIDARSDDRQTSRVGEMLMRLDVCLADVARIRVRNEAGQPPGADDLAQLDEDCARAKGFSFAQRMADEVRLLRASPQPEPAAAAPEIEALEEWRERFPPKGYCENDVRPSAGQPYVGHCSAVWIGSVENYSGFNPGPWDEKADPDWLFLKRFWRTGKQFYLYTDMCDVGSDEMAARSKAQITAQTALNKRSKRWDQDLRASKFRPSLGVKGDRIISHCYAYKGEDASLPGDLPD